MSRIVVLHYAMSECVISQYFDGITKAQANALSAFRLFCQYHSNKFISTKFIQLASEAIVKHFMIMRHGMTKPSK